MMLLETLALLTFMLGLLSLIVDVVRLTLEVMDKFSQKKNDDSKKIDCLSVPNLTVYLFDSREGKLTDVDQRLFYL